MKACEITTTQFSPTMSQYIHQKKTDPKSPIKEVDNPDNIYDDIYQTICSPRKSRMSLDISFSKKSK